MKFHVIEQHNDDGLPHLTIQTLDGNVHVMPASVVERMISGDLKITDVDDWEIIVRTMMRDWLQEVTER